MGAAGGVAVDLISEAAGYRAVATFIVLAAILMTTSRLRTLPPRAPIVRYGVRLLLTLSFVAAILSIIGLAGFGRYMVFIAIGFTAAAVLIPADVDRAALVLAGAALTGSGVAAGGAGILAWIDRDFLAGAALIVGGAVVVALGVIMTSTSRWYRSLAAELRS
jgi:hypothetical protein